MEGAHRACGRMRNCPKHTFRDALGDLGEQRMQLGEGVAEGDAPFGRRALAQRGRVAQAGAAARAAVALHSALVAVQVADDALCVVRVALIHSDFLHHSARAQAACTAVHNPPSASGRAYTHCCHP